MEMLTKAGQEWGNSGGEQVSSRAERPPASPIQGHPEVWHCNAMQRRPTSCGVLGPAVTAVISVLHAAFLPQGDEAKVKPGRRRHHRCLLATPGAGHGLPRLLTRVVRSTHTENGYEHGGALAAKVPRLAALPEVVAC